MNQRSEENVTNLIIGKFNKNDGTRAFKETSRSIKSAFTLVRVGIIVPSLISMFLSYSPFFQINLTSDIGTFSIAVIFLLCMILMTVGIMFLIYHFGSSFEANKGEMVKFFKNPKMYVLTSLILSNWALYYFPATYLMPFPIPIFSLLAFIFPFSSRPEYGILEIMEFLITPENLLGSLGFLFVVFTLLFLLSHLKTLIKQKNNISAKYTTKLFWLELFSNLTIILLLVYELLFPIIVFLFPQGISPVSFYQEPYFLMAPLLSLLFVLFLTQGSFHHSYFVINNSGFLGKIFRWVFPKKGN